MHTNVSGVRRVSTVQAANREYDHPIVQVTHSKNGGPLLFRSLTAWIVDVNIFR